jgi:putative PIN family toxin of toxin-antitoxin system
MLFVLDTNILVASLSRTSEHHWIIEALLKEHFEICVSHNILLEYEEVLQRKYGLAITSNFLKALRELPNVRDVAVWYQWNLLSDENDNKFVDAAIAGGASFIVSEDRHFRKLEEVHFPKITLMRLDVFKDWYGNQKIDAE